MISPMVKPPKSVEAKDAVPRTGLPPLGYVDWDSATPNNDCIVMQAPLANRGRIIRDQYVRIEDPLGSRTGFLGRIVAGPFFSPRGTPSRGSSVSLGQGLSGEISIYAEIELQGELVDGKLRTSKSRPVSRAVVQELTPAEISELLGFSGDMVLGSIAGQEDVWIRL